MNDLPISTNHISDDILYADDTSVLVLHTPCIRVLLEKLTGSQQSRSSPHFIELEGSLPHSQVPAACPYPEPALSSTYPHIPLPEDPS